MAYKESQDPVSDLDLHVQVLTQWEQEVVATHPVTTDKHGQIFSVLNDLPHEDVFITVIRLLHVLCYHS